MPLYSYSDTGFDQNVISASVASSELPGGETTCIWTDALLNVEVNIGIQRRYMHI
jgi:hypothetical protein